MPHYHATEQEHALIEGDGLLLIDSGGQYLGGTTDITRMVPVGTPTQEQKRDCTRVLKGSLHSPGLNSPKGSCHRCWTRLPGHRSGPRTSITGTAPGMASATF
jgi:Xaa-Pro aminopeptidase